MQNAAQQQLRQIVEVIERLEEDKAGIAGDIRDKFDEAKSLGFDVPALRAVIRLRKKSKSELQEAELILATYMHALGMIDAIPDQAVAAPREMVEA
jgi:uncharacterized protein (UPF0335 family)